MKQSNRMHARYRILASTLGSFIVFLASCEPWPPMEDELVHQFNSNRVAIEQLVQEFSESSFSGIRHGSAAADIYASSNVDDAQRPLSSDLGKRFRYLLEEAEVFGIIELGERLVILPYFDNLQSGGIISAVYVFQSGFHGTPSCDQFNNDSPELACYVQLDDGWTLMYNRVIQRTN